MGRIQIRRLMLGAVAAALLVVLLVWLSRRTPAPGVAAVAVARQDLTAVVTTNGKVEAVDPVLIGAELNAFVTEVDATEGRPVSKGQLILKLDTAEAEAQLARNRQALLDAQDALRAARAGGSADLQAQLDADQKKSEAEVERLRSEQGALQRLAARQAATAEEVSANQLKLTQAEATAQQLARRREELARRARLSVETAQLEIDRARAEIASLEKQARQGELRSPVDGTLYYLPVRAGAYVHTGDRLAEIADLQRLRVRAFVDEPELGGVEPGQPVVVTWDALPNQNWTGRTELVPKTVVPRNTRSVAEVLCAMDPSAAGSQALIPNINVNVRIIVHQAKNALVVPRGAVQGSGKTRYVYVVSRAEIGLSSGTQVLRRREVQLGISSATSFQVLAGLQEGEEVALPGDAELADGIKVRALAKQWTSGS
jgi:HlyD family secretion protein